MPNPTGKGIFKFNPKVTTTRVKLFFVLLNKKFEYQRYCKADNRTNRC